MTRTTFSVLRHLHASLKQVEFGVTSVNRKPGHHDEVVLAGTSS